MIHSTGIANSGTALGGFGSTVGVPITQKGGYVSGNIALLKLPEVCRYEYLLRPYVLVHIYIQLHELLPNHYLRV